MFSGLPEYPWEKLKPYSAKAALHSGGAVDLSVGSPVDPTPEVVQKAIAQVSNAPGYPSTAGSQEFRETVAAWFERRRGVSGVTPDMVMPTIGSKELISFLPLFLGIGKGDVIIQPTVAYTAYVVGAALVGAEIISEDDPAKWPSNTKLVWLNSPGNPDGRVLSVAEMKAAVDRGREIGALVASDECYAELGWGEWEGKTTPCILDPAICGDSTDDVLAVYSLSKQSNMAGYRAAFAAGSKDLVKGLVNLRMHSGLNTPALAQKAMVAALNDDSHVRVQKDIYRARRSELLDAVLAYGFEVAESSAGLYLWATLGEDCWKTVDRMADLGIVVVPGEFYTLGPSQYVRFSITATDSAITEGAKRLREAIN
ncbi:MAG: hypothetical protein RIS26_872 [Actinomycetota bacterium]